MLYSGGFVLLVSIVLFFFCSLSLCVWAISIFLFAYNVVSLYLRCLKTIKIQRDRWKFPRKWTWLWSHSYIQMWDCIRWIELKHFQIVLFNLVQWNEWNKLKWIQQNWRNDDDQNENHSERVRLETKSERERDIKHSRGAATLSIYLK